MTEKNNEEEGNVEFNVNKLQEFAYLEQKKKQLKDELKEVKEELEGLERELTPQFEKAGIPNISIGGRTVYIHNQVWAGYKDEVTKEEAVKALKSSPLEDYVYETYNTHSLSAFFREKLEESEKEYFEPEEILEEFPELKDIIKLTERTSLRSRKA